MLQAVRYAKTPTGVEEISARRNNLRGKMRTMLILIDPAKSVDELRDQASRIGAPSDFLDTLVNDGYIAPVGAAANNASATEAGAEPGTPVTPDELARFREAKAFMNETVVSALGIRAFMFTLKLERCATRADLGQLLPDYERALRKTTSEAEARAMADRVRELLQEATALA
ncbi:MAG TPA: hypothetical protein VFC24_03875 [Casimicrobiaceae bacterium]|nr:hypothetical protein [Casimicrobiaceae bacterium]